MKNLIPKSVKNNGFNIWRNIGFVDLLIFLSWFCLTSMLIFGLPLINLLKIILIIVFSLIAFPLLVEIGPNLKGWYFLYLFFKFLTSKRKYNKYQTNLLVAYKKAIEDNYIETYKINGRKWFLGCLEVFGYDITLLSSEEKNIKFLDLKNSLKAFNFSLTLLKIDLPIDFKEIKDYYQNRLNILKISYLKKEIDIEEYKNKKKY